MKWTRHGTFFTPQKGNGPPTSTVKSLAGYFPAPRSRVYKAAFSCLQSRKLQIDEKGTCDGICRDVFLDRKDGQTVCRKVCLGWKEAVRNARAPISIFASPKKAHGEPIKDAPPPKADGDASPKRPPSAEQLMQLRDKLDDKVDPTF